MILTTKYTEEEKSKASYFKFSFNPLAELEYYISSHYFPLINENTPSDSQERIPSSIPKHIIVFWHTEQIPEDVQMSINKIRQHNMNYNVELFNANTAYDFIVKYYGQELGSIYKHRCVHPSMQSDLFRICYLVEKGGIYVDVDIDCYAPIDKIFKFQQFSCLLFYSVGDPYCIDNDFIACRPGDKIMTTILKKIQENLTIKRSFANVWDCTGPGAVSIALLELLMNDILYDQENIKSGLKLACRELGVRAYSYADLAYKKDPACNWRAFKLPSQLYKL